MARALQKVGDDVVKSLEDCLDSEVELQAAHSADDWDRAWAATVRLKRQIARSKRLVAEFCKRIRQ